MEWVGGVNAQNTLHQTKAVLRAGCVSSPFMFLYFLLKDEMKKVRAKGDKVKSKLRERTEKVKREGIIKREEARDREKLCPFCLPLPPQHCWKALSDSLEWLDYFWGGGG